MKTLRLAWVVLVAVVPLVASCDLTDECPTEVKITVSADPDLTFDWSPACEVGWLWVWDHQSGERFWTIEGTFEPPVVYGVQPRGARTEDQPRLLDPGRTYLVSVLGSGLYGLETQGRLDFTVD